MSGCGADLASGPPKGKRTRVIASRFKAPRASLRIPPSKRGSGAPIRLLDLPESPKVSQNLIIYLAFQP